MPMIDTPNPPALDKEMPKATTPSIELDASQRQAIFGMEAVPPGESITVTLTASDGAVAGAGAQKFDVAVSTPETEGEDSPLPPDDSDDLSSSPEENAALGYDLGALRKTRSASRAPLNLMDLERD